MQRVKNFYLKELSAFQSTVKIGDKGDVVHKVQEWLNIWTAYNADFSLSLAIDGIYGPATQDAVKYFQKFIATDVTGAVEQKSWDALVAPLRKAFAFDTYPYQDTDIAKRVAYYAFQYEMWRPYEIEPNKGPWVRSFMDGHDGEEWSWCCGFAQTVLDSSYSDLGKRFTDYFEETYTVEAMRKDARKKGILKTNADILEKKYTPKAGDVFVIVFSSGVAHHTGIVTSFYENRILTIEGNTNFAGSNDGIGVFRLERDLSKQNIEIISIS